MYTNESYNEFIPWYREAKRFPIYPIIYDTISFLTGYNNFTQVKESELYL